VVLFAFAAFQSSPHSFMTLSACAALIEAKPRAPATKKAESAARKDVLIIVVSLLRGRPGDLRLPTPAQANRRARSFSCRASTEPNMNI
jgi:hypothetical protein